MTPASTSQDRPPIRPTFTDVDTVPRCHRYGRAGGILHHRPAPYRSPIAIAAADLGRSGLLVCRHAAADRCAAGVAAALPGTERGASGPAVAGGLRALCAVLCGNAVPGVPRRTTGVMPRSISESPP